MTKEYFLRLYEHANWANTRIVELLRGQTQKNERAWRLLGHILAAELAWITRLNGQDSSAVMIWPEMSLDDIAVRVEQNNQMYVGFLNGLGDDELGRVVSYKNSKGQPFSTSIRDILTHVAMHGANHRGQIATVLKDAGQQAIDTDFIVFTRQDR